jgi:hypothetical protein
VLIVDLYITTNILHCHCFVIQIFERVIIQMLAAEAKNKSTAELSPRHLWANDPEIAKIRRFLIINWIRSSIIVWILILLVALIYLGSGVVRI